MSSESTRDTMMHYFNAARDDVSMMAPDVVFTVMATGEEYRGPEGVMQMRDHFYHVAFDATTESRLLLFGENNAMLEANFVGRHIGEFAGIPATGQDVRVPTAVVYDLEGDCVKRARVYFEMPVLMRQLGVA